MRHTLVEQWSRGASPLHRRAALAKLIPALLLLIVVNTAHRNLPALTAGIVVLLGGCLFAARLSLIALLVRAGVVLPFTGIFAVLAWASGEPGRGMDVVLKSYVSALAVLTLVSTTPLPRLMRGLEDLRVPRFLITVSQFLYRYLFLIPEQAMQMRVAASSRGGITFRGAAGALAVLFIRCYERAETIHRAMLARGFAGHFAPLQPERFTAWDTAFAGSAIVVLSFVRIATEYLP